MAGAGESRGTFTLYGDLGQWANKLRTEMEI